MISIRPFFAVAAALATSAAVAQQATPAPAASDVTPPKHNCAKPSSEYPGNLASETQRRAWQKEYVNFTECLKKFISDQKALAEPHVKAYNAAVDEYNESVKSFNEQIEKARAK